MALMLAAELFFRGRVSTGTGAVAHGGQFSRGEQLQLPHGPIISRTSDNFGPGRLIDHAKYSPIRGGTEIRPRTYPWRSNEQ